MTPQAATTKPAFNRTTRSIRAASSILCVAISADIPVPRTRSISAPNTRSEVAGSRFPGRLVGQQQARAVGQRPAERHPLLLSPRHGGRSVVGPLGHPDPRQQLPRPRLGLRDCDPVGPLRNDHVFQRRKLGQQMVELVDETDLLPPCLGPGTVPKAGHVPPFQHHPPGIGGVQQPRDVQQRRFPRARRCHQRHDLALGHRQRCPAQHHDFPGFPA